MKQPPLLDVDPAARRQDDFYATPAFQTAALLRRLALRKNAVVIEPCAGDGAIVRVLRRECPDATIITNDIVERPPLVPNFSLDARSEINWRRFVVDHAEGWEWDVDAVITNPPFDVAFPIIEHAIQHARHVAFLLRLSWLEPTDERGPWLAKHQPSGLIVMPRYDYRGNGQTDSVTSAWMVWGGLVNGIDVVTKDERDELIAKYGKAA